MIQVWGLWSTGYRAINVLLHTLNALLVWQLLRRFGVRKISLSQGPPSPQLVQHGLFASLPSIMAMRRLPP